MESDNSMREKGGNYDVVVEIQVPGSSDENSQNNGNLESNVEQTTMHMNLFNSTPTPQQLIPIQPSNPTATLAPIPDFSIKPPVGPSLRQRVPPQSAFSKPKSRILEPSYSKKPNPIDQNAQIPPPKSTTMNSPNIDSVSPKITSTPPRTPPKSPAMGSASPKVTSTPPKTSAPITPRTPLMSTIDDDDDDNDDEVYKTETLKIGKPSNRRKRVEVMKVLEWILFVCLTATLVTSLTINSMQNFRIWSLELWKWCVLAIVIFCSRLITEWFTNGVVFLLEMNFLMKKKVLYFVFALKKSFRVVIWLGSILLAWTLLINRGVARSPETSRVLNYITRGIVSTLVGAVMWMLKTLVVKIVASSYHVRTYFDRIQESIFHQYILQVLSGIPTESGNENGSKSVGQLSFNKVAGGKEIKKGEVINVDKLYKMRREKISAWTMGGLIKVIRNSDLPTVAEVLDDSVEEEWGEPKVISSEVEAFDAANRIFRNVAKPHHKYIDEEDLLRFLPKEEVDNTIPLFEGAAESRKIKKSAFRSWVVKAYNERKCLAVSLSDSKTAIEELNRVASVLILVVIIIVWLLLMELATTQILVFISSQLLLVVFMFGNSARSLFESMIFVFIVHPFDVGDRCVIDGMQMVVDEMNILTTIFLKPDNEKIYYPNAVLATKAIGNFNRSPDMGDSVEFGVDFSTSVESIAALKEKIKAYLESRPQHWNPNHSVQMREIVDVNKMIMALYVTHTINFQNPDRGNRRSDLVFQLKKIFEELGIIYRLLPQEVHISYSGQTVPSTSTC